jgi:hypothetical protein
VGKKIPQFSSLVVFQQEDINKEDLHFSIPIECPKAKSICFSPELQVNGKLNHIASQSNPHTSEQDDIQSQQASSTTHLLPRKRKQRQLVLVDSDLRRSLRIKAFNTGYKATDCGKETT